MATHPAVLAVVVNWNGEGILGRTLASLQGNEYPALAVVVVDNASQDRSLQEVRPGVRLRVLEENLGYGGAINREVQAALQEPSSPEWFLLLNHDVELEGEAVTELVAFAQARGPGVYGPKVLLLHDPHRLDAAWGFLTWSHVLAHYRGRGARDGRRWSQPREVPLLLGCALLVHREVFRRVGLFDENFFMYHEEVDFLYRVRQAGFPVFYVPSARAYHFSAYSTRREPLRRTFWIRRNTRYFLDKHRAGFLPRVWYWSTLSASLTFHLLTGRWRRARVIWQGVREAERLGSPGPPDSRRGPP